MNERLAYPVLAVAKTKRDLTVNAVVEEAAMLGIKTHDAAEALHDLQSEKMLWLEDPAPPRSLLGYTFSVYCSWFWTIIAFVAVAGASVYLLPQHFPYVYLRYVLGSVLVLYLPGYSLLESLHARAESLSAIERLAFSSGLSLALTSLMGLVLNYTPWGIRLDPLFAGLSLMTVLLSIWTLTSKFSAFKLSANHAKTPRRSETQS